MKKSLLFGTQPFASRRPHIGFGLLLASLVAASSLMPAATLVVDNAGDVSDGDFSAGQFTLREAIANANAAAGSDTIQFAASVTSIALTASLPSVTETLILDGSVNATRVTLDGATNAVTGACLVISSGAANCEIYGLEIHGFSGDGITASGAGLILGAPGRGNILRALSGNPLELSSSSSGALVQANIFGLLSDGTTLSANTAGIEVRGANHTFGGDTPGERNVVAGASASNTFNFLGGTGHKVQGNYIGTDATGTLDRGASAHGIYCQADNFQVGGPNPGEGNLIAGNNLNGIHLSALTTFLIQGNTIGLSSNGTTAIPNATGIQVLDTNTGGTIRGNVISGNTADGINCAGDNQQIHGNWLGLGTDGTTAVPNGGEGLDIIASASGVVVGSSSAADRNVISGNATSGMNLGASGITVQGNYFGTDSTGLLDVGNATNGITVGSGVSGATLRGNVFSGNGADGINCAGDSVQLYGNLIGLGADGSTALGNSGDGVEVFSTADGTVIGSATTGDRNVVSSNTLAGLRINGTNTVVKGNYIGTDAAGSAARGNGSAGSSAVFFGSIPSGTNVLGGTATGEGNVISGNLLYGVHISSAPNTDVIGNIIGLNATGTGALGNANTGILVQFSSNGTRILNNVVSRNGFTGTGGNQYGIRVESSSATVQGNKVGTDASGNIGFGNQRHGISIVTTPCTVGGLGVGEGNLVMGNGDYGIEANVSAAGTTILGNVIGNSASYGLALSGSSAVTVQGNIIGLNPAGSAARPNNFGVWIGTSGATLIGGTTAAEANVISGNNNSGILYTTSNATIRGNFIGTDPTGLTAFPNVSHGLLVTAAVTGGVVRDNVIAGNGADGINCGGDNLQVHGNKVGLGSDGTTVVANAGDGIEVLSTADSISIGSASTADRNVISGNGTNGITADGTSMDILGNYIGVDATGALDKGNGGRGIYLSGPDAIVGAPGAGNVISGNSNHGIILNGGAPNALIQGNIIGLDATGSFRLANSAEGVSFNDGNSDNSLLGGTAPGAGNVISGNNINQVYVAGSIVTIQGNTIGPNAAGTASIAGGRGIQVTSTAAETVLIGGTAAGAGNLISGNSATGMQIDGDNVTVQGNTIGLTKAGDAALPNTNDGIVVGTTASGILIGSTSGVGGNVISGNGDAGVYSEGDAVTIQGNFLGTDPTGSVALGNGVDGISLGSNSDGSVVRGNVISGNLGYGIYCAAPAAGIYGNTIGLNAAANAALANNGGVQLTGSGSVLLGSSSPADRNLIGGNTGDGVRIEAPDCVVTGNAIGTNAAGTADFGNTGSGIHVLQAASSDSNTSISLNTIAHSTLDNVLIAAPSTGVEVGRNSIDADCRFPISFNGVLLANDALDTDAGANNGQNHPTINPATAGDVAVTGALSSTADTSFTIHLFSSAAAHSSGNGPGETWLASTQATTNAAGNATWSVAVPALTGGRVLSALATAPTGDTSLFSPAVTVFTPSRVEDWGFVEE